MVKILYVVAIAVLLAIVKAQDYCDIQTCSDPSQHVLCLYNEDDIGDACGDEVESTEMSAEDQQEVLELLNGYRARVASGQETRGLNGHGQPAATNLGPLVWDDELAEIAQTWANQCRLRTHASCSDTENERVGQCLAYAGSTANYEATSMKKLTDQWYNEVDKFDGNNVGSVPASAFDDASHYIQLMWADTTSVGCGLTQFYNKVQGRGPYKLKSIVCNFGPTGGYVSLPMYKTA